MPIQKLVLGTAAAIALAALPSAGHDGDDEDHTAGKHAAKGGGGGKKHAFSFLTDTYETERLKTLQVWSQFKDEDLKFRPNKNPKLRTPQEHMIHQSVSEDTWMKKMLEIDAGMPPAPKIENKLEFIKQYAAASGKRLELLRQKPAA